MPSSNHVSSCLTGEPVERPLATYYQKACSEKGLPEKGGTGLSRADWRTVHNVGGAALKLKNNLIVGSSSTSVYVSM